MIEGIVLVILFAPIALLSAILCLSIIANIILEIKDIFK